MIDPKVEERLRDYANPKSNGPAPDWQDVSALLAERDTLRQRVKELESGHGMRAHRCCDEVVLERKRADAAEAEVMQWKDQAQQGAKARAEAQAIVARERQERDAAEAEFSRLLAGKLAAEARVEELEREKESREAWWKRRIAEHQQAERDYLAEVRRLEGLIADIAEDAIGDDAPINRGLNSVQACIREREARHGKV